MNRVRVAWILLLWLLPASVLSALQNEPSARAQPRHKVRLQKSVPVAMRDGVKLSTDLYIPEGISEKLPVILIRTPYNKNPQRRAESDAYFFAGQGYLVAVQDVRGRFESGGIFTINAAEREDGYDTVGWLSRQSWSNGKVGTYGCSYLGENQIQLAALRHPNHAAAISQAAGGVTRWAGILNGGTFELAISFGWFLNNGSKLFLKAPALAGDEFWASYGDFFNPRPRPPDADYREVWKSLPLVDMLRNLGGPPTDFEDFLIHEPLEPWWEKLGYVDESDRFDVPAIHVNSWYDYGVAETLDQFNLLKKNAQSARGRDHQFAIISPTTHCLSEETSKATVVGDRPVGDARLDYWKVYLDWFGYWLKGEENGITRMPRARLYVMGRNEWRESEAWPLPQTVFTKYYLHSDGRANSRFGSGTLRPDPPSEALADEFSYDPRTPVPSLGGPMCCTASADAAPGAFDQFEIEIRNDVLVYSTPPLTEGVEITGPMELVLYVSSTGKDTDFTGKLVDVYPDGKAYNVQEGILRARYREGLDRKVWMEAGATYELRINLHATSNYFGPGHRIRLEVSSSSFPRFDRNLNTGGNNYDESNPVVVRNTIHHSEKYPSHLILPVIP